MIWVNYGKILQMGMDCYFNCHDRRYLKQYEEVGIGIIYSNLKYQVDRMRGFIIFSTTQERTISQD
jgi:hypothetical protein